MKRITVLGVGSELMGDDGFGPAVIASLGASDALGALPDSARVDVVDGGVGGMRLLAHFTDSDAVVVVDAIDAGAAAGTLMRFTAEEAELASRAPLSSHEVGLPHVLDMAHLTGARPEVVVIACQVQDARTPGRGLSDAVRRALDGAVESVVTEVRRLAAETQES